MVSQSSSFPLGMIVQSLAGIVSLVCCIIVIVKLFQAKQVLLGIISIVICGLGGFICGWIKAKELGLQKIMMAWTGAIGLSIIGAFLPGGTVSQMKQIQIQGNQKTIEVELPSPVAPAR